MDIRIPAPAQEIIEKLNENGYEAYIVGGCVRDMLLGREPEDWDITTSALPEQVKQVFHRTIDTGIQHGTITVMMDKEGYEVTTYRIDGEYSDGRHPNSVEFTSNLTEDLRRRDFTINAMAYNGQTGFVDEFGGVEDLKQGIIRCVGDPMDRFTEDALRILRAIRFSAQLGFSIESNTYEAIKVIAPNMVHVSRERIQVELTKLLVSSHPEQISMVYETGISPYVSDAFHKVCRGGMHEAGIHEAGMPLRSDNIAQKAVIPFIPVSTTSVKHMRWAAFLRFCSPDEAVCVLKDLKLDNDTINRVRELVTWQGRRIKPDKHSIRVVMSRLEPQLFDDLLALKMSLAEVAQRESRPETQEELQYIRKLSDEIRRTGDCVSLKTLAVTGHDIMAAGVKPGKEVGLILARLLELVLEDPTRNTKEYLLECLR